MLFVQKIWINIVEDEDFTNLTIFLEPKTFNFWKLENVL